MGIISSNYPHQDMATQFLCTVPSGIVMFLQYSSSRCKPKLLQSITRSTTEEAEGEAVRAEEEVSLLM